MNAALPSAVMKRTLCTLLACCLPLGMAQAETGYADYDITLNFVATTPTYAPEPATVGNSLLGTLPTGTLYGAVQMTSTDYVNSFLSPSAEVGNTQGTSWQYMCTFTAVADFTLTGLDLAMVTFDDAGNSLVGGATSELGITLYDENWSTLGQDGGHETYVARE